MLPDCTSVSYRHVTIWVMSGTGNTLRVASWFREHASALGLSADLSLIAAGCRAPAAQTESDTLLALFYPTHGFTAPWLVLQFVARLPAGRGAPAVIVVTRGGTRFGNVNPPGLEGTAGYLVALLLAAKGYRVRGVTAIDMPCNWTACHSGLQPAKVANIVAKARPRTTAFARRVLAGQRCFGGSVSLLAGLLLLPVSVSYLVMGRFFLAKLFFASDRCTGCGACARNCPAGAILMLGRAKPRPYWTFGCEGCMRCMSFCPVAAVEAGHSWGVLLFLVSHTAVPAAVLGLVLGREAGGAALASAPLRVLVQYLYCLAAIAVAYRLFWFLIRRPALNRLFSYTTFTRLYRRYHEPETRLTDLTGP
jgi:ferredoxin